MIKEQYEIISHTVLNLRKKSSVGWAFSID